MATNLRNGSTGSDVKKLQQALIEAGYDVGKSGADGVFGKNTAAAVKAYQKANGLAVDGIAGKNTLGSLYGTSNTAKAATTTPTATVTNKATNAAAPATASATPTTTTTQATTTPTEENASASTTAPTSGFTYQDFTYKDFSYNPYDPSDVVNQANTLLQQQIAAKPGEYQSQWQDQINSAFDAYNNRDPFSYDFNADALYQQYKDNYIQQGQMAMMDTMGQASAMTGGYGNSYAQNVGQQAYHQYLNQLNNVMPQLYQMAYDRYDQEGTDLYNQYNMLLARENKDYSRYQDDLNNWYTQLQYLTDNYNTERELDYQRYQEGREQAYNQYVSDKNIAYNEYNAGKDKAWDEYLAQQERDQAAAELMASTGNFDRLGDVYGLTEEELAAIQKANAPKKSGGGGSGKPKVNYKDIDVGSTAYNSMMSEINKAGNISDLASTVDKYLSLGYNPDQVQGLTAGKAAALTAGGTGTGTDVPPTGLPQGIKNEKKYKDKYSYMNTY